MQDREIPFEQIDLYEIARDCVEMLQLRAKEREVDLRLEGGLALNSCRIFALRTMASCCVLMVFANGKSSS